MISCPDCGKPLASHTARCPYCGYPLTTVAPAEVQALQVIGLAILACCTVVACSAPGSVLPILGDILGLLGGGLYLFARFLSWALDEQFFH